MLNGPVYDVLICDTSTIHSLGLNPCPLDLKPSMLHSLSGRDVITELFGLHVEDCYILVRVEMSLQNCLASMMKTVTFSFG